MRTGIFSALLVSLVTLAAISHGQPTGLIVQGSAHDISATVARLESAIKQRGATILAKVDHTAAAKANGLDLRPTLVILFGNPKLGTPLMQSNQTAGLDLPLRILVWQDAAGAVMVGYWAPATLAEAHSIRDREPVIKAMSDALSAITGESVKP